MIVAVVVVIVIIIFVLVVAWFLWTIRKLKNWTRMGYKRTIMINTCMKYDWYVCFVCALAFNAEWIIWHIIWPITNSTTNSNISNCLCSSMNVHDFSVWLADFPYRPPHHTRIFSISCEAVSFVVETVYKLKNAIHLLVSTSKKKILHSSMWVGVFGIGLRA